MFISARLTRRSLAAGLTLAAASAALTASASAGPLDFGPVIPVPDQKIVMAGPADLVVSKTTTDTITVANRGLTAAGAFAIQVGDGKYDDQCGGQHRVPGVTLRVTSLLAGASKTLRVYTDWSATDRYATVDALNQVRESNEYNNHGTLPGGGSVVC